MRITLSYIPLLFILLSCNNTVDKPIWLNPQDIVRAPTDSLQFTCKGKNWKASLLGFTQPIAISTLQNANGLTLSFARNTGIIEGPAQLMLSNGKQSFFYDLVLKNASEQLLTEKDYRSPKTVNPDSSMNQQSITFAYDQWHNLIEQADKAIFFSEQMIALPTKAGTYHAQAKHPLSAYYVQPGSIESIPIQSNYLQKDHLFEVIAGPLKDAYGNLVANGTMVLFQFTDGTSTYSRETASLNGYASTKIKATTNTGYVLTATIHNKNSRPLKLGIK